MASNRSRRLTADQARELFRNLHDEESENSLDESDSDFSSNESRSRVIVHEVEDESRSSDRDFDDRGALPRPSRSRRALPQSGPSNSRNRSRSNIVRPVSDWNNVNICQKPVHCCSLVYLFGGNNYWLTFSVTLHSAPKYFINF